MWEVVLWLHVILAWIAVEAYDDGQPYYEYLFSRRDGIAYVEPLLVPIHNDSQNSTVYVRNQHPRLLNTSIAPQDLYDLREPSYELQSSGQRLISHRRQRVMKAIPDSQLLLLHNMARPEESRQCVLEQQISMGCDHCICMGGQLYICTSRKCNQNDESTALRTAHQKNSYFQANPECIEGEAIKSFDECNRCYCGGGQVLCTRKKCSQQLEHQNQCTPGARIPSPDNCNSCACNSRGFIVCTVKTCGPDLSTSIRDKVCIPNLWFSMTGAGRCKECYCVNGKTAFCFVKLCVDENKSQRLMLKNAIQSIPGILPSKCRKLDYMQDQCTKCYCNDALTWICRTTNSKKCTKKIPDIWGNGINKNTRRPHTRPPHHGGYDNHRPAGSGWHKTRTPPYGNGRWKPTRPKHPTRPVTTTSAWEDVVKDWFNWKTSTKYTYESKPTYGSSTQPPDLTTKPFIYSSTNQEQPYQTTYETTYQTPYETPYETTYQTTYETTYQTSPQTPPHFDLPSEEEEEEPHIPEPPEIPPEITHSPKTTFMQTPEDVPPFENDVDSKEDLFSVSEEEITPPYTSPPPGFHSTVHPFEPTMSTVPSFGGSIYTNVARGPFCVAGKQISLGSKDNCQGCICTSTNEWKCWSVAGPCNNHAAHTCNSGKLKKNSKSRCSVCYCGSDQTSFCATDVACANNIRPISTCDALSCMDSCSGTPPGFGICQHDECVCIQ